MADPKNLIIRVDGTEQEYLPADGQHYTLEDLKSPIGGHRPNTGPWIRLVQDVDLEGARAGASCAGRGNVSLAAAAPVPRYNRPAPPPQAPRPSGRSTRAPRQPQATAPAPEERVTRPRLF